MSLCCNLRACSPRVMRHNIVEWDHCPRWLWRHQTVVHVVRRWASPSCRHIPFNAYSRRQRASLGTRRNSSAYVGATPATTSRRRDFRNQPRGMMDAGRYQGLLGFGSPERTALDYVLNIHHVRQYTPHHVRWSNYWQSGPYTDEQTSTFGTLGHPFLGGFENSVP